MGETLDACTQLISALFGARDSLPWADASDSHAVKQFIDDPSSLILRCAKVDTTLKATCETRGDASWPKSAMVFLTKQRPLKVDSTNLYTDVAVSYAPKTALEALYSSVHVAFAPVIGADRGQGDERVREALKELDGVLGDAVRRSTASKDSVPGVYTIMDEYQYWNELARTSAKDRERAGLFSGALRNVAQRFSNVVTMSVAEVLELIDDTQTALDQLWRNKLPAVEAFPAPRMKNLLNIIGHNVCTYIATTLSKVPIWGELPASMRLAIEDCARLCEAWVQAVELLTGSLWTAAHNDHVWPETAFHDISVTALLQRLLSISSLRNLHDEMTACLPAPQRRELGWEKLQKLAAGVNPFSISSMSTTEWQSMLQSLEKLLEPMEAACAANLSSRFKAIMDSPQALSGELNRFTTLFSRRAVSKALTTERESIVAQLQAEIESIESDTVSREKQLRAADHRSAATGLQRGRRESDAVVMISWAQAARARIASSTASVQALFRDLPSFKSLVDLSKDVEDHLQRYQQSVFRQWCDATEEALRSGKASVDTSARVMEFDAEGNVVVHYNEHLVNLLRDVRQLSELGLTIPEKIRAQATEAERHYRFGVQLHKVATFYNSLGAEIIPVQKPLLYEALVNFERVVDEGAKKSGKAVSWADAKQCADFVEALQRAAENLSVQNRKLRGYHSKLCDEVAALFKIDLVKQKDAWRSQWTSIGEYFRSVCRGIPPQHTQKWASHWSFQLYKVIEAAYRRSMESLNESMPEIRVELAYLQGNKHPSFKPAVEEVRSQYYKELKKFVTWPCSLTTLEGQGDFSSLISHNAASLSQVYRKAEILFARLQMLKDRMRPWVSLGCLNIEAFVEERLHSITDMEATLSAVRVKRRELERLPDMQRIDCITVSLIPFKTSVDLLLQRLSDTIVLFLKRNIVEKLQAIEQYLEDGNAQMSFRPSSFGDIAKAQRTWRELSDSRSAMRTKISECEDYRRTLATIGMGLIDISDINSRMNKIGSLWDTFEAALDAFTGVVDEQRAALRQNVSGEVETMNAQAEKAASRWKGLRPTEIRSLRMAELEGTFTMLSEWEETVQQLRASATAVSENCASFGLPSPSFPVLEALEVEVRKTQSVFDDLKQYIVEREKLASQDWLSFRARIFELQDFAVSWLEKVPANSKDMVLNAIATDADAIRKSMTSLKFARGEPFKEEHWTAMFKKLGMPKTVKIDNVSVAHFLDVLPALQESSTWLKELSSRAQGEVLIRDALQELKAWFDTTEFKQMEHVSSATSKVTWLIKEWKDLFTQIGDNQSLLSSLKDSPYFKPFADTAAMYEDHFAHIDQCSQTLNAIQRKWVYLEPVLSRGALPSEQGRFKRIDDDFQDIMAKLHADPRVVILTDNALFPNLQTQLTSMLDQLDRCQRALSEFLEERRAKFPRFYFIGDDDLLEILGQSQNPSVIQAHLKKLFQGVHRVVFSADHKYIEKMCSANGEEVTLYQPVAVTDDVTVWLTRFADEMVQTLSKLLQECCVSKATWFEKMVQYPSQIHCLAEQVAFTQQCESVLSAGGGPGFTTLKAQLEKEIAAYTSADVSKDALLSLKVKALTMDAIHHMDVLDQLVAKDTKDLGNWTWQKQLRFYLEKGGKCVARMVDAELDYSFEYQGNAPKLVHTPLTDKCYMVLSQGLAMGLGGNPYGPAGTGKTESVKALGATIGRQVLVFNCDEGIDFQSMGRIFIGIVKCGAWGCFDEFNRLKEDQLSAISQQIQVIQAAIKEKTPSVKLLGVDVKVNFQAGIFVTLNPAGKGYGGRSKLPDNLKQLFRPVAMTKPDNEQIAEVILYCEGFMSAKDLGKKVVAIFTLSSQLLSVQQHYDWGLRSMKTVLNTGGSLIQQLKRTGVEITPKVEAELLIKAIRVNTLSKLTFADARRFVGLLQDVFPGVASADVTNAELEAAIRETMADKHFRLEFSEAQFRKMLQLKEALDQRIGCLIVGPSGCGKTVLWQVLKAALAKCGQQIVTHVMNPKSMPRSRLLGEMDHDTREWTDGVLTAAARQVVKEPQHVRSWIVCDGDVDPEWIESLNSVLDDNHLLTLPNGERIAFGANVNFLFETHDLKFASPATVSRMGLIYMSDDDVDVGRVVRRWLSGQTQEEANGVKPFVDQFFNRALQWALNPPKPAVVETTLIGLVTGALSQLKGVTTKQEAVAAFTRGFGANFDLDTRAALAKEVSSWFSEKLPDPSSPLDFYAEGNTYKSFATLERESRAAQICTKEDVLRGSMIPVATLLRTMAVVSPWMDRMEPFVLVGPEGCGKSLLIQHLIKRRKACSVTTLNCSSQTSAEHVIQKIRQFCVLQSSSAGRVFRPREGDRLVLYLKDINLPKPDKYGTCSLIAFLQQLLTFHGFYDENREFLGVEKVHIVASMTPSSSVGRHALSTRFTAIVRLVYMDYPEARELTSIYGTYLNAFAGPSSGLRLVDDRFQAAGSLNKLAQMMVEIHQSASLKFTVDEHRHYLFTPRELTSWVRGLSRYDLTEDGLLEAVSHEALRIYRDRLVDQDAAAKFDSMLAVALRSQWSYNLDARDLLFSTLLLPGRASGSKQGGAKLLRRVATTDFVSVIERGLVVYEREERQLGLQLFQEVLTRIAALDRILSTPGGCALLVGRAGVGRRSAAAVISHMRGYKFVTPSVGRNYGLKTFITDLKAAIAATAVEGEDVTFYVEDHQLQDDAVLETVNSFLASGEVPGMYAQDELDGVMSHLKEEFAESNGEHRTLYEYFVEKVRRRMHIVLAMDSSSKDFVSRCEHNPAFYTRCSIIWMGNWSKHSCAQVTQMQLREVADASTTSVSPECLAECLVVIHESMQAHGASPRDLVAFVAAFRNIYAQKVNSGFKQVDRLRAGLGKLEDAQHTVDDLSRSVAQQRELLKQKQAAADQAMNDITAALGMASDRKKEVEVLQQSLAVAEKETRGRKAVIEDQLTDVMPLVERAKAAVGSIKRDNLDEIRSLKMPPEAIADVLSAVLLLLGTSDTSWNSMKKFLGNRGVKEDILGFDARRITPKIRAAVTKLIREKADSFEKETISRASFAAAPLADWVVANLQYSETLEKIAPLEEELAQATAQLARSQEALDQNKLELEELDLRVKQLKDEFAARTAEAESLRQALAKTEDTLNRAQSLLSQLAGERDRWRSTVEELHTTQSSLPYVALLASAMVTYCGKFSEDIRHAQQSDWFEAIKSIGTKHAGPNKLFQTAVTAFSNNKFDLVRTLASESDSLEWKANGLPSDNLSVENVVIILSTLVSSRTAFIIDPATRATEWLQSHLAKDKSSPLEVITPADGRFQNQVELAIRFGKTLFIKDCDRIEPMLYPVLRRDFIHQGPRMIVQMGDKQIDVNDKFRLFISTRNAKPNLPPDAAAIVTEVNFTVTKSGLESQLLGATIQHEQPELETTKSRMLQEEEQLKLQLLEVEDSLLAALAQSSGNLLENATLLASLSEAKTKSSQISASLEASEKAAVELDRQRREYQPFAKAGATLFFVVNALQFINNMYQYSLDHFLRLFRETLANTPPSSDIASRIAALVHELEVRVLLSIGTSLLKEDRVTFGLHLVHVMRPELFRETAQTNAAAGGPLWKHFIGDVLGGDSSEGVPRDFPLWASKERLGAFKAFKTAFPTLVRQLDFENAERWSKWSQSQAPERDFPTDLLAVLTSFERLLVIKILRPDRLHSAMQHFVCEALSLPSINPPSVTVATLFETSRATQPILMITMAGADPSRELSEFAASTVGKARYVEIAMGGGVQQEAIAALKKAAEEGQWVCFKNLHLVTAWLPVLEKEFTALTPHTDFRLWLTTECHPNFAPVLLQLSLKATFEAPPGIKKSMQRTFEAWGADYTEAGNITRAQLLYLLAWLNAIVQERRTYVPQGWTKLYEFSSSDLRAGANVIDVQLRRSGADKIPWAYLHGLIENTVYGGRIDNASDLRVLRAYLATVFHPDVLSGRNGRVLAEGVRMPESAKFTAALDCIESLPDIDPPHLFCLPGNIDRSVQRARSTGVIQQLQGMASVTLSTRGFDKDTWTSRIMPLVEVWDGFVSTHSAAVDYKALENDDDPISAFLLVELRFGERLATTISRDFAALKAVLLGSGLLSSQVLEIGLAITQNTLPKGWMSDWEGPEDPAAWLQQLMQKLTKVRAWCQEWIGHTLLERSLNLADLFKPATFLNALRQRAARAAASTGPLGLDKLKLISAWSKAALPAGCVSIAVTGLYIQGASFDAHRGRLVDVQADAAELESIADAHIAWVPSNTPDPLPPAQSLSVPVYPNLDRSVSIMELSLPCPADKAKWVLAGVALFTTP